MRYVVLIGLALTASAFAQQPADDMEMARNQFMVLFGQCDTSLIKLQQQSTKQLADKDAEIAKLKADLEASKKPVDKQP